MTIKKFTVIGERCTGTNLAKALIERNLGLEYVELCAKHYFQPTAFENKCLNDLLVIATVRDPFQWVAAMWVNKHDMTIYQKHSMSKMLFSEQIAVYDDFKALDFSMEIMENRHIYEKDSRFPVHNYGRRYANIFEMRNVKHKFLLEDMPKLVPHFEVVNYESMRDEPETVLKKLCIDFDLIMPQEFVPIVENVKYYAKEGDVFKKRVYELDQTMKDLVKKNVDHNLESALDYTVDEG
jgi:hypothetical protein